tara:strand:+ start:859 stop:1038 length:180 start_codon:yes stop_codon:yes gene_type:complete
MINITLDKNEVFVLLDAVISKKIDAEKRSAHIDELTNLQNNISSALREQSLGVTLEDDR